MPKALGILSDSHGQHLRVRRAVQLLQEQGATHFVHLGDLGERELDELAGLPVRVVFGNCDDERTLERYARSLEIEVLHPGGCFEFEGRRIGVTHGHLLDELDRLFRAQVDFLLHGHTHQRSDATVDGVRVINPGALHRATPHTAAILVPSTGVCESIVVS
ncbi:MAG: YfcE family phosphodiesterase [Phycisphaerae bacterium]|nr:YfcE family phosphodiesterase [Phycisphaerae bacterium]